jgi:flavin reductase (DIM6/NTAB) family NADH-FMN oxidoreductase RutF
MTVTGEEATVTDAPAKPDLDLMKQVNRQFVTGVTVVTVMDGDRPRGLAVNAFSSISLDPPTVLVCVQRTSSTYESLFRATHLAINILSVEQIEVVNRFASKAPDKFEGLTWEPGRHGSPMLPRSSAQMEVEIRERLQASTHTIFICRVVDAAVTDAHPMVYGAGRFYDGGALAPLG